MKIAFRHLKVLIPVALALLIALPLAALLAQQPIPPAEAPVYLLAGMKGHVITVTVVETKKKKAEFAPIPWDKKLNEEGVPQGVINKLKKIEGLPFFGKPRFMLALQSVLEPGEIAEYFPTIAQVAIAHPHPNPRLPASQLQQDGNTWTLRTGKSNFTEPEVDAFTLPPGTNQLPNVYTNLFDGLGCEMPNTLPSTKRIPYNLHDGEPVVTEINQTSPTEDLLNIFNEVIAQSELQLKPPDDEQPIDKVERRNRILRALKFGIDILEGNRIHDRYYSGFPLLHYNGPNKIKYVSPITANDGSVVGGNVDIHQVWYDNHIESDAALLNAADVWDVPWTITYTIDMLSRGHDDFSPFGIFTDDPVINNPGFEPPPSPIGVPQEDWPGQAAGLPHYGMDQSFFPMDDGTRTVVKIKMPPGKYFHLIYTWGWRMHPPRIQSTDRANKVFPGEDGQPKTLVQFETDVFGSDPMGSPQAQQDAIAKIGELAPAKRMWRFLRAAHAAALAGDYQKVIDNVGDVHERERDSARVAYFDWTRRGIMRLPRGVPVDDDSDLTLLFVNNTIYGQFTDGGIVDFPPWTLRAKNQEEPTLKVTLYNGDYFRHGYVNVDFGGSRGWENLYKSSVQVGGSGCWFTFGRANWWVNNTGMLVDHDWQPILDRSTQPPLPKKSHPIWLPPADPENPDSVFQNVQHFHAIYNYEPSRRLRFYQFDPTHHDVAILSIH